MLTRKKTLTLFLLTAMILGTCVSCGSASTDTPVTGEAGTAAPAETDAETEEADSLAARLNVSDGLTDTDYGGRTFHILGDDECEEYYTCEEETGDALDDAVYERNATIKERFNVDLQVTAIEEGMQVSKLKSSVMAGDDEYQLFAGHIILAGMAVCDSIYYNWYDVPHIDFTKPWWSDSNIEDLTYGDKAYLAMGDFALTTIASTYCFYFNKQLAADYDIGDMYEIVNSGKWTADMLISIAKNVYRDLNGDGTEDESDLYGYAIGTRSPINTYLWAFGEKLAKKQDDGTVILDYYNDKVVAIYQKLLEMTFETPGVLARGGLDTAKDSYLIPGQMFENNQVLFLPELFDFAATNLREFDTDYGIIPYPKWDEAQEEYYTMVDGGHEGLAIPASVQDLDFVGTITEALNAESWKRVVPAYYDIVLKTKGTRDETSVVLLDRILENRIFDFGYVYGQFGAAFWPQYLAEKKSSDIASYYEKNHKAYDKDMEEVFEFFNTAE